MSIIEVELIKNNLPLGLFTPSPGVDGGGSGHISSSSSLFRHQFNQVSRSSRQPSPSDGQQPHQTFAVSEPEPQNLEPQNLPPHNDRESSS